MILQLSVYALAYIAIAIIASVIGMHIWNRRTVPGGLYFILLLEAITFWAFMCTVELTATDELVRMASIRLEYVAVTWAGPLWLLFALDYGYRSRWPITRKTQLIWIIPIISIVISLTNEWQGLIWPGTSQDMVVFLRDIGLWTNLLYTYALVLAGFVLLLWATVSSSRKNYLATAALVLGTMIPVVTSLLYAAGLNDGGFDLTPFALGATILLYAWSVFGQHLFYLMPVAREVLYTGMTDGVLVIDRDSRIAGANPAAREMFDITDLSIGQPLEIILSRWPEIVEISRSEKQGSSEVLINGKNRLTWLDIRVSALHDSPGMFQGRLVVLHNITNRKLAEDELKRTNASLLSEIIERKQIEGALKQSNSALQAEVAERIVVEGRLGASLKEKELLLKEIHHRVKNNLQIISSLISLQTMNTTNENTCASLRDSQNRIKSMALIHEKLYQSKDLARIDFKGYVNSLVKSLSSSYVLNPGLKIIVDIEDVCLDIDTAIPCGLIINELVSNSLKYAFTGRNTGEIRIVLSRNDNAYRLAVSDDGVGMAPGIDFKNTTSLGLMLVVTLAEQINGSLDHPEGPGTMFVITFPENSVVNS